MNVLTGTDTPVTIGIYTKIMVAVGLVCAAVSFYLWIVLGGPSAKPINPILLIGIIVAWGIYLLILGFCVRADNPDYDGDE